MQDYVSAARSGQGVLLSTGTDSASMVVSRVESAKLEFKVALNVQDQRVDLPLTCNYSDMGRLKEKECNNWHILE